MPNDILCTAPRDTILRESGRTRISATGASAAKMSQVADPGRDSNCDNPGGNRHDHPAVAIQPGGKGKFLE